MSDQELLMRIFEEMQGVKQEMHGLQQDVQGVKQEMNTVKQDVKNLEVKMNQRFDSVDQHIIALEEKMEKQFDETVKCVGDVVDVIGGKIAESEKGLMQKVAEIGAVTAQNAYDVQYLKLKNMVA